METEEAYREVFNKVSKSVVIVENRNTDRCCIGSVVGTDTKSTFILTSFSFIDICNQIFVHINDNTIVKAKKLVVNGIFILLGIDYRADCTTLQFRQRDVDVPSEAVVFAPDSMSYLSRIPAFVIQPSCAARDRKMIDIEGSGQYFLFSCHYMGLKSRGDHNMLISAPVFDLSGKAIGLTTSQCGETGNKVDVKIGLSASSVEITLNHLHEERRRREIVAGTDSSAGTSKRKRKLRKAG